MTPASRQLPPRAVKQTASPATRQLPARSARQTTSYAPRGYTTGADGTTSSKYPGKRAVILSDTSTATNKAQTPAKLVTSRNKIRQDIADITKPKRDTFFLAKKDLFLPLLPNVNYISKLERDRTLNGRPVDIVPSDTILSQPQGITATMKPYQKEGLAFLVHMYHNGMSAILGDEMGLGKTLQTLALFQHLKVSEPTTSGENRPFLVVCPLSVLSSWATEAAKWTPDFKVIKFHGPRAERERLKQETMGVIDRYGAKTTKSKGKRNSKQVDMVDLTEDVQPVDLVITTYETFVSEQNWFKRAFAWRYIVTDEGHKLKN